MTLFRFAPSLAWTCFILVMATESFGAESTASLLELLLGKVGVSWSPDWIEAGNFAIRKFAHLLEYGILAASVMIPLRPSATTAERAIPALVYCIIVAAIDETIQSHVPSRTGSAADVVLDLSGALAAIGILLLQQNRIGKRAGVRINRLGR